MSRNNQLLVAPIYNLRLSSEIKKEIWLENVLFIEKKKLLNNVKRVGFPWSFTQLRKLLVGKPQAGLKIQNIKGYFEEPAHVRANAYAIIQIAGNEDEHIAYGRQRIEEAVNILASSQLGNTKRGNVIRFGAPEHGTYTINQSLIVPTTIQESLCKGSKWVSSPVREYLFKKEWKGFKKVHFMAKYIDILNGGKTKKLARSWTNCLKKAAILAGKSVFSKEISMAFLFNMIAIEILLKKQGEKYMDVMPKRINDLFGWIYEDDERAIKSVHKVAERLYKLRNNFVHSAEENSIRVDDLIETDVILSNLLYNFCQLITRFKSQDEIIRFSEECGARRILGLKIKRPEKLRFLRMHYYKKDFERIQKRGI